MTKASCQNVTPLPPDCCCPPGSDFSLSAVIHSDTGPGFALNVAALQASSANREEAGTAGSGERVVFEMSDSTQEQMEGGDRVKKLLLSSSLSSVCWLHCNEVNIYSMLLSR